MNRKLTALLTLSVLLLSSCEAYKSNFMLGWTYADAQGIQPVRANPPTIGYRRLQAYATVNQAMKMFLQAKGMPDYIIEKPVFSSRIACFYLTKNHAYLLEMSGHYAIQGMKVLGPEPIGEKDLKLFKALNEVEKATAAYQQP